MKTRLRGAILTHLRDWTGRWGFLRRARLKLRDWVARSGPPRWQATRDDLSFRYLRGDGIEIGALFNPLRVPPEARVTYVDHAGLDELREIYSEHDWVQAPDVIDEGERLEKFADESLDFVIANHMLEHVEDPIEALENFLRVLRPGGILFLTLPDARHTFDGRRTRTTLEHLLRDHQEGPQVSRREHYEDIARIIDCVPEEQVAARADEIAADRARHHYHVWELETFLDLLFELGLPVDVEAAQVTELEFAVILRKNAAKSAIRSPAPSHAQRST
ncbi:MAG: methyltransferase domain-containing protein [Actinobacteria bacterium]|nr:MAG: methyltransferase domain-containing protein [Actinomycetota bacterium]